ncbi:MAG: hypothetical protein MZU79_08670 [Anaerotruncus sp.]|nr:hypothetical protein [Anaerotruncus sp.]
MASTAPGEGADRVRGRDDDAAAVRHYLPGLPASAGSWLRHRGRYAQRPSARWQVVTFLMTDAGKPAIRATAQYRLDECSCRGLATCTQPLPTA